MVKISSRTWSDGAWHVCATITLPHGTLTAPHVLDLPEDASDAELSAAVLTLYAPAPDDQKREDEPA